MSPPTDPPSPDSGPPEAPPAARRRALVIDDEPSIRLALRRFLSRQGWHVDEAADGRVALDQLTGPNAPASYDLIICDLRMPGCTGAELHERLKATRPDLLRRLIVATGDAVSADAAEFVRRTSCPVLQKPFELNELRAIVDRLLTTA